MRKKLDHAYVDDLNSRVQAQQECIQARLFAGNIKDFRRRVKRVSNVSKDSLLRSPERGLRKITPARGPKPGIPLRKMKINPFTLPLSPFSFSGLGLAIDSPSGSDMTLAIYDGSGVFEASSSNSAGEQESSNPNVAVFLVSALEVSMQMDLSVPGFHNALPFIAALGDIR
ncbi:hypothetical protein S83_062000 [Arachis hypogaea]